MRKEFLSGLNAYDVDKISNIDSYISSFPLETQKLLNSIRETIHQAAPDAVEKISYGMPAFYLNGNLVYFAAYKNHIGFYPSSSGIRQFQKQISGYKNSKGAVQFPLNQDLPLDLISIIVKFRVKENIGKKK